MPAILIRTAIAFVLVATTYNPTNWNFVRWAESSWGEDLPMVILAGLLLFIGYVVFLRATLRSIGPFGMLLIAAVLGALIWVLIDRGWLTLENPTVNAWIGVIAASLVLGIGLSWSIIRRRISGQADVDDVDA